LIAGFDKIFKVFLNAQIIITRCNLFR